MMRVGASVLMLIGGVVTLVGLPLQWFSESTPAGTVTRSGLDYAAYDIVTTVLFGVLLLAAAFGLAAGRRWAPMAGVVIAVLACLWAALVIIAAASPADAGSPQVKISIGLGAYAVAAGALLALIGAVLSFRGRNVAVATSGVPSSV